MKKVWHLGTFLGVPIKIHPSIVLMLVPVAIVSYQESLTQGETLAFSAYLACLFLCVLLHEYGHVLMARYYGIKTKDIILSPIGGIARLRGFPDKPGQEIMVAIAGPLVNVAIVLLILLVFKILGIGILQLDQIDFSIFTNGIGFLHMIMMMNGLLCLFNLIPAFPMDGGRIFRALLSYRWPKIKATFIAMLVGRVFAIAFMLLGLYNQKIVLIAVGLFVFVAAGMEYSALKRSQSGRWRDT